MHFHINIYNFTSGRHISQRRSFMKESSMHQLLNYILNDAIKNVIDILHLAVKALCET